MSKADLLDELRRLESLRFNRSIPCGQRQFQRHVIRGDATLFPTEGKSLSDGPIEVQLRDVARGGLGFLCQEPLEAGTIWRVEFRYEGMAVADQTLVVRHHREVGEGLYLCGGQFIVSAGLLSLLGVPRRDINYETVDGEGFAFFAPADVA
jgi:hypothetical protein